MKKYLFIFYLAIFSKLLNADLKENMLCFYKQKKSIINPITQGLIVFSISELIASLNSEKIDEYNFYKERYFNRNNYLKKRSKIQSLTLFIITLFKLYKTNLIISEYALLLSTLISCNFISNITNQSILYNKLLKDQLDLECLK